MELPGDLPPIAVIPYPQQDQPMLNALHQATRNQFGRFDFDHGQQFNVILQSDSAFKVRNVSQLERLTTQLLNKPILTTFTPMHEKISVRTKTSWRQYFVTIINTQHPSIKEKLESGLAEAMKLMRGGNGFSIKFDFRPSITRWFGQFVRPDKHPLSGENSGDEGAVIWITNGSIPEEICLTPWWIICFPLWIFFGPCYLSYRRSMFTDMKTKFSNLEVNLMNIHVSVCQHL